jgi:hypothetical protein
LRVEQKPLDRINRVCQESEHFWLSSDGRHYAAIRNQGIHAMAMEIDGKKGPDFLRIDGFDCGLPADLSRVAYPAQDAQQHHLLVIQHPDGTTESFPVLAGNSQVDQDWHVLDGDRTSVLNFNAVVTRHAAKGPSWVKVGLDGHEMGPMEQFFIAFDPTGSHYVCLTETENGATLDVYADGERAMRLRNAPGHQGPIVVSPSGSYYIHVTTNPARPLNLDYFNAEQLHPPGTFQPANVTISPDGRRLAYVERNGARSSVVVDEKKQTEYEKIEGLAFTGDSGSVIYVGEDHGAQVVVVDGKESNRLTGILQPLAIDDGHRAGGTSLPDVPVIAGPRQGQYAYLRRGDSGLTIVRDGAEYPLPRTASTFGKPRLQFSANGRHVFMCGIDAGKVDFFVDNSKAIIPFATPSSSDSSMSMAETSPGKYVAIFRIGKSYSMFEISTQCTETASESVVSEPAVQPQPHSSRPDESIPAPQQRAEGDPAPSAPPSNQSADPGDKRAQPPADDNKKDSIDVVVGAAEKAKDTANRLKHLFHP